MIRNGFKVAAFAGLLAGFPLTSVAVTIVFTIWQAEAPAQPMAPVFMESDFAEAKPLQGSDISADIEEAVGGQFRVSGPVTIASGLLSVGSVALSAPVRFSEAFTIDEDVKMRPYTVKKGTVFFRSKFTGSVGNRPESITALCGPVEISGLVKSVELACLARRPDGNTSLFLADLTGLQPLAVNWFPTGINMNDKLLEKDHYAMPKMTPATDGRPDMSLQLVVDGGRNGISARWQLTHAGEKRTAWLFSGGEEVFPPNWIVPTGPHFIFPLGSRWLAFDYDNQARQINFLGDITSKL